MSSEFDASNESDDDLVVLMGWKVELPAEAKAAFEELYRRHMKFIYDRCSRAYASDIGEAGVEDLVQDTFWRAYEKANTYDPKSNQEPEFARRSLRAWLFRFAHRLFLDFRRKEKSRFRLITGEEERVNACEAREESLRPLSQDEKLVQQGMNKLLDDCERDILTTFASYYNIEKNVQQPPEGLVDELCERWSLLPENVRQKRWRALKTLEEFVVEERERTQVHVATKG